MAKASGIAWTTMSVDDVTGSLTDFSITLNGQFNPAGSHKVLRQVTSSAVIRTTSMVVNAATLPNEVLYTDYTVVRAAGGDLNWSAAGSLADGTVPTWS